MAAHRDKIEADKRIITALGTISGLTWVLYTLITQILWGPHIDLPRTVLIGASAGANLGLFVAILYWVQMRHVVRNAWLLLPGGTIGWMLGGMANGFLSYVLTRGDIYGFSFIWRSLLMLAVTGFIISGSEWVVLRIWMRSARVWVLYRMLGFSLSALTSAVAGGLGGALGYILLGGQSAWMLVLLTGYAFGTIGGVVPVVFATRLALSRMLRGLYEPQRSRERFAVQRQAAAAE